MKKRASSLFLAAIFALSCVSCEDVPNSSEKSLASSTAITASEVTTPLRTETTESLEPVQRELSEAELKDIAKKGYQTVVDYIKEVSASKADELPTELKVTFVTSLKDHSKLATLNNRISDTIGKGLKVEYKVNTVNNVISFKVLNEDDEDGVCGEYLLEEYEQDSASKEETDSSDEQLSKDITVEQAIGRISKLIDALYSEGWITGDSTKFIEKKSDLEYYLLGGDVYVQFTLKENSKYIKGFGWSRGAIDPSKESDSAFLAFELSAFYIPLTIIDPSITDLRSLLHRFLDTENNGYSDLNTYDYMTLLVHAKKGAFANEKDVFYLSFSGGTQVKVTKAYNTGSVLYLK